MTEKAGGSYHGSALLVDFGGTGISAIPFCHFHQEGAPPSGCFGQVCIVQKFLDRLASGGSVSFRTFDDDKTQNKPTLIKFFHGTIQEHAEALIKLNNAGASVNVMINAGNGNGAG
ncbi:MAG: hypothetical protein HQL55_16650 [Magnetococcales bacterium]|nr:hypothetical protein [Magnetococcales bacterium]